MFHVRAQERPIPPSDFPEPGEVFAIVKGTDDLDTAARQLATLEILRTKLRVNAGGHWYGAKTEDEIAKSQNYVFAIKRLQEDNSARAQDLFRLSNRYEFDREFQIDVLTQLLEQEAARLRANVATGSSVFENIEVVAAFIIVAAAMAYLLRVVRGEFARTRLTLDGNLFVRRRCYQLHVFTGVVLEATKRMEPPTNGGGERQKRKSRQTGATVHDKVLLLGKNARQESVQLTNFDINCEKGSSLSVVKAIRIGRDWGPKIVIYNHDAHERFFGIDALEGIHRPHVLWYLVSIALGLTVGLLLPSADIGVASGFVVCIVVAFLTNSVRERIAHRRADKFRRRRDVREFLAGIDEEWHKTPVDLPGGGYVEPI